MRLNALWWWIDRWRKSTAYADMTLEEQGAYRNLLDEANLRGGAIPNDERILAKACGDALAWKRIRKNVLSRFELRADGWHNETLDKNIAHYTKRAEKQARYRNSLSNAGSNAEGNAPGSPISDLRSPISEDQELRASRVCIEDTNTPEPEASPEDRAILDRMRARGAIRGPGRGGFEPMAAIARRVK